MKKLLSIILLTVASLCMLISCGNDEPTIEVNVDGFVVVNGVTTNIVADKDDVISVDSDGYVIVNGIKTEHRIAQDVSNEIHYPLSNLGTKIEALPLSEQQKIDDYVYDCKTVFSVNYAYQLAEHNRLEDSYILFTDVFVYDLSKIDENNLDGVSVAMWNEIKALNGGESAPVMYIELSGFCSYPIPYYRPTYFSETGMICGYFIFENETCAPMFYKQICTKYYSYKMIDGAEFINCGNKYSEEKGVEELTYYYEVVQSGSVPEDFPKRLNPVYK